MLFANALKVTKGSFSTTPEFLCFDAPTLDFRDCDAKSWNGGSAVRSHFWNSLSSLLPNIEFCAIRSLLPMIETIGDEKLQAEVKLFCSQESAHGNLHGRYNSQSLHAIYPFTLRCESWERRLFSLIVRFAPRRIFLSLFVAVEHWTAAFSQFGLAAPDDWFENCDPTMFRLWEWHAVEELAHKSVCYDVYRYHGGGYLVQVFGMFLLLFLVMLPGIVLRLAYFFWKDGMLFHWSTYSELSRYLLGRRGVLHKTFREFLSFFNPSFQPWDTDSLPLIRSYQARH